MPENEVALLVAGGLGGPFTISVYTPLRNAITLGSREPHAATLSLYRKTFARGFAGGWTGWAWPSLFSCPQFLAMGPLYHFYAGVLGSSNLAVIPTALTESLISFGSQARNAQEAYNVTVEASKRVALQDYSAGTACTTSDHTPVTATYQLDVSVQGNKRDVSCHAPTRPTSPAERNARLGALLRLSCAQRTRYPPLATRRATRTAGGAAGDGGPRHVRPQSGEFAPRRHQWPRRPLPAGLRRLPSRAGGAPRDCDGCNGRHGCNCCND